MPGAKQTQPSTETTKPEPKYTLEMKTQVAGENYTDRNYLVVVATLLVDGEVLQSDSFNWDADEYYETAITEWAKALKVADQIRKNGAIVKEIEL